MPVVDTERLRWGRAFALNQPDTDRPSGLRPIARTNGPTERPRGAPWPTNAPVRNAWDSFQHGASTPTNHHILPPLEPQNRPGHHKDGHPDGIQGLPMPPTPIQHHAVVV